MFMQSAAMALGFGSFFQYGKRKISSMSNEEFNVLTPEALTSNLLTNVNNMIPTVEQSFHQMEQMNVMILDAMAKYFEQGVNYLEKWIQGGIKGFTQNVQTGITDPISEGIESFFDSGGQLIPSAGAEDYNAPPTQTSAKLTAVEKYASQWINAIRRTTNFGTISIKQAKYLLGQFSQGNLPTMLFARAPLLRKWESLQPKILTPKEQLVKTKDVIKISASGIVKQISEMFATLTFILSTRRRLKPKKNQQFAYNSNGKAFLNLAKKYNQFVAINRKPKLQIDTAKSLASNYMVKK